MSADVLWCITMSYCFICVITGLNKWVEIGNSGVFRPEMLLPMGLPEDVSVIAWGLSLERSVHRTVNSCHFAAVTRQVGHPYSDQVISSLIGTIFGVPLLGSISN